LRPRILACSFPTDYRTFAPLEGFAELSLPELGLSMKSGDVLGRFQQDSILSYASERRRKSLALPLPSPGTSASPPPLPLPTMNSVQARLELISQLTTTRDAVLHQPLTLSRLNLVNALITEVGKHAPGSKKAFFSNAVRKQRYEELVGQVTRDAKEITDGLNAKVNSIKNELTKLLQVVESNPARTVTLADEKSFFDYMRHYPSIWRNMESDAEVYQVGSPVPNPCAAFLREHKILVAHRKVDGHFLRSMRSRLKSLPSAVYTGRIPTHNDKDFTTAYHTGNRLRLCDDPEGFQNLRLQDPRLEGLEDRTQAYWWRRAPINLGGSVPDMVKLAGSAWKERIQVASGT
jgi:hypothetical protein